MFDSSGGVVPGAKVDVQNQGTSATVSSITDASGNFIAPSLPVGSYRITISAPGFKTNVRDKVSINSADRVRLEITLEAGEVSEKVTVSAEAPLLETASTTLGGVVNAQRVQDLPMNGRSITQLLAVIPGVMLIGGTQVVGGAPSRIWETGAKYLVDGGDSGQVDSDLADGGYQSAARINRISADAVEEMRVQQNQFSAEYGQGIGGVVNYITKSGTNQYHASVFEYFRNEKLDSRNYFNAPPAQKPSYRLNQFGGTFGGPILRDRLFFFVNLEDVRQRRGHTFNVFVPTATFRASLAPALQPAVDTLPLPNGAVSSADSRLAQYLGNLSDVLGENTGGFKVDYQITSSDRFSARYNVNQATNILWQGVGANQARNVPSLLQLGRLNYTKTVSSTIVNEASMFINRVHTDIFGALTDDARAFPAVTIGGGMAPIGPAQPELFVGNTSYTWLDTLSWIKGNQQFKFGAEIVRSDMNKARGFGETLTFQSLNDYVANSPFTAATIGYPRVGMRESNFNFFAQDDIQVSPRLSLNLGLRYQYDTSPSEAAGRGANYNPVTGFVDPEGSTYIDAPKTNFGPRLGIAYTPFASKNTVIRAGVGMLYSNLQGAIGQYMPANIAGTSLERSITRAQLPGLSGFPFPNINQYVLGTLTVRYMPFDWKPVYTEQANFNIQQGLGRSMVLQVGYVGNRTLHLDPTFEYNPIVPGTGARRNPRYGSIQWFENGSGANFNALQVGFKRRLTAGLTLNASYTWEHIFEDNLGPNPSGPREYATATYDVTHYLEFDYTYQLPAAPKIPKVVGSGWQINGITTMRTGTPYTVTCGCDPVGVGSLTGRPDLVAGVPVVPVNYDLPTNQLNRAAFKVPAAGSFGSLGADTYRGPNVFNWDFSMFKNFSVTERQQVQFRAEMFNLFNTPQFGSPAASLSSPSTFGQSRSTLSASTGFGTNRQIQFALRYSF
ncbi:MAG: TonB-dependent receptor [Acidobacteriia bacterium]|nr:TonB-dependent receptor [Terriglobia bacterium]